MIKSYFDIFPILGTDKYLDLSNSDKSKYFFMVNRQLSRVFPEVSSTLSHVNVNTSSCMDFWNQYIKFFRSNKRNPYNNDFYDKLKSLKKKKVTYTQESLEYFLRKYSIGTTDLQTIIEYGNDLLIKYLIEIDKNITNTISNEKKVKS